MHWKLVAAGVVLLVTWLLCWLTSVVPGSSAVAIQWTVGNASAFLAGLAFGAAALVRRCSPRCRDIERAG